MASLLLLLFSVCFACPSFPDCFLARCCLPPSFTLFFLLFFSCFLSLFLASPLWHVCVVVCYVCFLSFPLLPNIYLFITVRFALAAVSFATSVAQD